MIMREWEDSTNMNENGDVFKHRNLKVLRKKGS